MLVLSSLSFSAKKLYVGTNAEFMPYEYLENGKMVGFDIELMDAIGKELGYEIVWSNMGFDGLLPALQMKKIDAVIAGMSQTPERQKAVTFSMPYMLVSSDEHFVIVNENSPLVKKEELKGKKSRSSNRNYSRRVCKRTWSYSSTIQLLDWSINGFTK